DDARGAGAEFGCRIDPFADPVAVTIAQRRMRDVTVVDQEGRQSNSRVEHRGSHLTKVDRFAAFKMEMAELQVANVALRDGARKLHQRETRRSPFFFGLARDVVARCVRM